jgi:hypothetical protein
VSAYLEEIIQQILINSYFITFFSRAVQEYFDYFRNRLSAPLLEDGSKMALFSFTRIRFPIKLGL